MNVSMMLNLKVMFIIGLLLIGLTAITADENENRRNEGINLSFRIYIFIDLLSTSLGCIRNIDSLKLTIYDV